MLRFTVRFHRNTQPDISDIPGGDCTAAVVVVAVVEKWKEENLSTFPQPGFQLLKFFTKEHQTQFTEKTLHYLPYSKAYFLLSYSYYLYIGIKSVKIVRKPLLTYSTYVHKFVRLIPAQRFTALKSLLPGIDYISYCIPK